MRLLSMLLLTVLLAACQPTAFRHDLPGPALPWTAAPIDQAPGDFTFAVVGDRTGLPRAGVFEHAVTRLALLQPAFVVNVGDMIDGYTDDPAELLREWDEQDARLGGLDMRFFRVVGNHDIGSEAMRDFWRQRYGPDYYAFVYRDVLFVALSTEDPPTPMPEAMKQGYEQMKALMRTDPGRARQVMEQGMAAMGDEERARMRALASPANFSEAQIAWLEQTLAAHRDVRWTFVFMHKPAWEIGVPAFGRIEALLADRPYTVFGGHEHNYHHTVRNGRDYIRLGTVGGGFHHPPPGNVDHVLVVNVRGGKPGYVNLRLDGIQDVDEPQAR